MAAAAPGHEVVIIGDDGSREATATEPAQVSMAVRGLALLWLRHLPRERTSVVACVCVCVGVCVCARACARTRSMSLRASSHDPCGWLGVTWQRSAASNDTESDDDANDFQAPGGASRAAMKAPAGAGLPPGPKSGVKRRGKENLIGTAQGGDSDDDSDFKAPAKKARGKKEASKGQQRGISSFFSRTAAPSAAAKGCVPARNEGRSGGAVGSSKANEDLQLGHKGVIPHYIASQLQAHQVRCLCHSADHLPFLCRRCCGVLLRFCALLGNTHASRRWTAFSSCGSTSAPSRRRRSAGASLPTPWAWARVCR